MSVSLVVLAKNEAANIEACLDSARGVDELLVIDDFSEDNTAALAEARGARVLKRKLDDFGSQFNYGFNHASGDWIFVLDADERFTPGLMRAIEKHVSAGPVAVGTVLRRNFAFKRRLRFGPLKPDRVPRLFPRGAARWQGLVHPQLHFDLPQKPLGDIIHYTYRDWEHYFSKQDQYSAMWAQNARLQGKSAGMAEIWGRLLWHLFKMYFLNLGLLGGPLCWALCYFSGEYTLKKYIRLMELNEKSGP